MESGRKNQTRDKNNVENNIFNLLLNIKFISSEYKYSNWI